MNVMLAATLACLSYVPFEYVAKGSLVLAVLLFIVDPVPPISRLLSLVLVVIVGIISKLHRQYIVEEIDHSENGITSTTGGSIENTHHHQPDDTSKINADTNITLSNIKKDS